MITSSQERFTCAMYPEPAKITDAGLTHAWGMLTDAVKLSADHPKFQCGFAKSDFIEALAMIGLEITYRWEHLGGKEKFKAICPYPEMVV
jgi:hypothetical protein